MRLSVIIVTHNRRAALRRTLDAVAANPSLPHDSMEVIVIDNGSNDGTADECQRNDLDVHLIRRERNEGVSARNYGFEMAKGEYLLLIDDDSYPLRDAVSRSLRYLDEHPSTAAVVGRVELPDGTPEASALPGVVANGALCIRRVVMEHVGGLPREFFRQAEEYDLSFRVWNAGFRIERFEDLIYRHEKAPGNRAPVSMHRFDIRNNTILAERFIPARFRKAYRRDWADRYFAHARHAGCLRSAKHGWFEAQWWRMREPLRGRQTLLPLAFESVFEHMTQRRAISNWVNRLQLRRVMIADYAKNIYATWQGALSSGAQIVGVFDPHPAFLGGSYRHIPIWPMIPAGVDGVIIANINPAQIDRCEARVRAQFDGPVLRLWEPQDCPVPSAWFAPQRRVVDDEAPLVLVPPSEATRMVERRRA